MNRFKEFCSILILMLVVSPAVIYSQSSDDLFRSDNIKPPGSYESDFLPVSVWYSGGKARAPMLSKITSESRDKWLKDLRQIKSLGFNTVRTWVEWTGVEPREGEFNFENLHLLMELAEEVGLKVFIQMYVDSAPDWVGEKYGEDALYVAQSGDKMIPQSAPGYSIDHPGVRRSVAELFQKTAEVAIQYPNFYGWDVWSEPHIINWASMQWVENEQFGFNPHTQERFRNWLKQKYENLDSLNEAWYRTFLNWDTVTAPRFSTILSYTDFMDWKLFLYDKLAGDMRFRYNAIRSVDSTHVITAHASPASIWSSPMSGRDAADDFQRADQLDFYGLSTYPKHNEPDTHWPTWMLQVQLDFSYSANKQHKGFYVGELQAGKGTVGLAIGDPVTTEDHREWIWTAIASGAKGINVYAYYPMSSGYESGGYGLVNLDGTLTDRSRTTGEIAKVVDRNSGLFANSSPVKPEIAIVYNPLAQMVGGYRNVEGSTSRLHSEALVGYYRFFAERNIPVDFVHRRDLEENNISQYKLVIVPYSLIFTEQAAQGLTEYLETGGRVVGEARLAWNDIRGFAADNIPGMGLSEVFGVREAKINKVEKVSISVTDAESELLKGIGKSDILTGALFAESLEPMPGVDREVNVLAEFEDGTPAVTSSGYGKGEALFVGSFLGLAKQTLPDISKNNDRFLNNLLGWADVKQPFEISEGNNENIQVRLHQNKDTGDYLLFLINHNESGKTVTVDLNLEYLGIESSEDFSLTELISERRSQLTPTDHILTVNSSLLQKEVEVWHIETQ